MAVAVGIDVGTRSSTISNWLRSVLSRLEITRFVDERNLAAMIEGRHRPREKA